MSSPPKEPRLDVTLPVMPGAKEKRTSVLTGAAALEQTIGGVAPQQAPKPSEIVPKSERTIVSDEARNSTRFVKQEASKKRSALALAWQEAPKGQQAVAITLPFVIAAAAYWSFGSPGSAGSFGDTASSSPDRSTVAAFEAPAPDREDIIAAPLSLPTTLPATASSGSELRKAIDATIGGHYEEALVRFLALQKQHPEDAAYGAAVEVLREKVEAVEASD